jgi:hypothetical protein
LIFYGAYEFGSASFSSLISFFSGLIYALLIFFKGAYEFGSLSSSCFSETFFSGLIYAPFN